MRWLLTVCALAACGDNRHIPDRDSVPLPTCEARGKFIDLEQIVHGCGTKDAPLYPDCLNGVVTLITAPRGDSRLFAVELDGRIRIIENGHVQPGAFLDISEANGGPSVGTGITELGFLGLAFHPEYAVNHTFFVYYTAKNPDTTDTMHPYLDTIARYTAIDADHADRTSGTVVLAIPDPFANHNGGMLDFDDRGLLYLGTGDGGGIAGLPADPYNNAQNPHALLGKMLRLDIDHKAPGKEYGIPFDNPFADGGLGAPEVYLLGLRNPWRWSFDRATGDMWIGDVGAATLEEVDFLPAGHQAGKNLGWPMWEAELCYAPPCDPANKVFPVASFKHTEGWWAMIGGQVYRGSCFPDLVGTYVFTDCGASQVSSGRLGTDGQMAWTASGVITINPASLHAADNGELYQSDISGNVWHVIARSDPPPPQ